MATFSVDNFCLNFCPLQTGNYSADRSLNWFAVILMLHAVNHRVRLVNRPIAVSAAIAWDCGVPKVNLLFCVFIRKRACIPKNERKGFALLEVFNNIYSRHWQQEVRGCEPGENMFPILSVQVLPENKRPVSTGGSSFSKHVLNISFILKLEKNINVNLVCKDLAKKRKLKITCSSAIFLSSEPCAECKWI